MTVDTGFVQLVPARRAGIAWGVALALVTAALLPACGGHATPVVPPTAASSTRAAEGATRDWSHPIDGDFSSTDLPTATSSVPFVITLPSSGNSTDLFISPSGTPKDLLAVVFVVRDERSGTYWITESLPDIPDPTRRADAWKTRVAENGQPGWHSTAEIVSLSDGTAALLGTDESGKGAIEFVIGDVQFGVIGERITPQQVVGIAGELAAATAVSPTPATS
jgi:hypothetical protein